MGNLALRSDSTAPLAIEDICLSGYDALGYEGYERRIINHSPRDITVVEHSGIRYTATNKPSIFHDLIVVYEQWSFPKDPMIGTTTKDNLKLCLSSDRICDKYPSLKALRGRFTEEGLDETTTHWTISLKHEIKVDEIIDATTLYHHGTALMFSILEQEHVIPHPFSVEGDKRLAQRITRLDDDFRGVGMTIEYLVDRKSDEGNQVFIVIDNETICSCDAVIDCVRAPGIYIHYKRESNGPVSVETLNVTSDGVAQNTMTKWGHPVFNSFNDAKNLCVKRGTENTEHEKWMLERRSILDRENQDHKFRMIAMEREQRIEQDIIDYNKGKRDEAISNKQHEQRSTEAGLKTMLAWATAMIGGVTLFNKLF